MYLIGTLKINIMKQNNLEEQKTVYKIITIACGALNLIYSAAIIYVIITRIVFLGQNKAYITVFDYIYLAIAAFYALLNIVGTIFAIVTCFVKFQDTNTVRLIMNGFLFFGMVVMGIILLFVIGILISLGKTEFKDYLKFLLFNVIIAVGVGLVLSLGTFLPMFLFYNDKSEFTELPTIEMKKMQN